ncbi:MAG: 6-phosphogluconolactonase [Candidatus Hydrogenedentes bacterium]|nr:6-phosphogluconolactonase [Candidatus Hydrogenedentota bacterium]
MLPSIIIEADYEAMSRVAAEHVLRYVRRKPDSVICVATGASPVGVYAELAKHREALAQVRILKLDEWGGLAADDPATCDVYIRKHILEPWGLAADRSVGFLSTVPDPAAECRRVQQLIRELGGIDICVLGMGADGHIGLNYPAESLPAKAHVTDASTLRHAMLDAARGVVTHGLTLGMTDVLHARHIVLVVSGGGKAQALARLVSGEISTQFPASLLWLHPEVTCVADQAAAAALSGLAGDTRHVRRQ